MVAIAGGPAGDGSETDVTTVDSEDTARMTATEPPTAAIASADAAMVPFDLVSIAPG
jgi:hypothetical protein